MAQKYSDIDEYVASLGRESAVAVQRVRALAHEELPGLGETIAYNMATFERDGRSVLHLAGWKTHVAIYPEPTAPPEDAGLVLDLAPYSSGKGTLRFPLSQPLDEQLVRRTLRALGAQAAGPEPS
ncbi:MAG: DUF1801 domain-containing protein [Nocardioides sp.]|nr:DUF1801 domain-containing protein [Nocardioides sp.]